MSYQIFCVKINFGSIVPYSGFSMSLRNQLSTSLKTALKARSSHHVATVRLILAAVKDRDIAAREDGNSLGITDEEIMALLQSMIKQRRESIALYQKGGRHELARQEEAEIEVIQSFLPTQMTKQEIEKAVDAVIVEMGADNLRDMGRVMAALRERYAGQLDFAAAGAVAKARLG